MRAFPKSILLVALLVTLFGCAGGNREKDLVGKWTGKLTIPEQMKNDPNVKMAESMMSSLTLELKEDKKFVMTMMFPFEGTWSVAGDTLNLKVEKAMGMSLADLAKMSKGQPGADKMGELEKPMEFKISGDNKTLTAAKKGALAAQNQGDMVFTKT